MKLLTTEIIRKLPRLYANESKKPAEVPIVVKFFDPTGSATWYATEGEQTPDGDWKFFGWVEIHTGEFGYFLLSELENCKKNIRGLRGLPIERDIHFKGTLADVLPDYLTTDDDDHAIEPGEASDEAAADRAAMKEFDAMFAQ